MRKMVILIVVCFLLFNSTAAFADYSDGLYVVGDIAFARPFGLVATVVGGAIFVVCLPFALPSGSVNSTADALVGEPFRFTFERPLGNFSKDISYGLDSKKKPKE